MRILIVEDSPFAADLFTNWLTEVGQTDFRLFTSDGVEQMLKSGPYHIALVDLQLSDLSAGRVKNYEGIRVISRIRSALPDCLIVAYSTDMDIEPESVIESCRSAGADEVISRTDWFRRTPEESLDRLKGLQTAKEAAAAVSWKVKFSRDIPTRALEETIGLSTIHAMVRDHTVRDLSWHMVSSLSAGHSGSLVFRVESRYEEGGGVVSTMLIKADRQQWALEKELRGGPLAGSRLASHSELPKPRITSYPDGWRAIGVQMVHVKSSLRTLLTVGKLSPRHNKRVIVGLVDLLAAHATDTQVSAHSLPGISSDGLISHTFCAEVLEISKYVCESNKVFGKEIRDASAQISKFMYLVSDGLWNLYLASGFCAPMHGDLHSDNILVDRDGNVHIIDFGRGNYYPRLYDIAALDVDSFLSAAHAEGGEDLLFDRLADWYEGFVSTFPFQAGIRLPGHGAPLWLYLPMALRKAIIERINGVGAKEYAEMLLFHLLRYLRFPTITPPKKALAILVARDIIRTFGMAPGA